MRFIPAAIMLLALFSLQPSALAARADDIRNAPTSFTANPAPDVTLDFARDANSSVQFQSYSLDATTIDAALRQVAEQIALEEKQNPQMRGQVISLESAESSDTTHAAVQATAQRLGFASRVWKLGNALADKAANAATASWEALARQVPVGPLQNFHSLITRASVSHPLGLTVIRLVQSGGIMITSVIVSSGPRYVEATVVGLVAAMMSGSLQHWAVPVNRFFGNGDWVDAVKKMVYGNQAKTKSSYSIHEIPRYYQADFYAKYGVTEVMFIGIIVATLKMLDLPSEGVEGIIAATIKTLLTQGVYDESVGTQIGVSVASQPEEEESIRQRYGIYFLVGSAISVAANGADVMKLSHISQYVYASLFGLGAANLLWAKARALETKSPVRLTVDTGRCGLKFSADNLGPPPSDVLRTYKSGPQALIFGPRTTFTGP